MARRRAVLPSISVNKNVTSPLGSMTLISPRPPPPQQPSPAPRAPATQDEGYRDRFAATRRRTVAPKSNSSDRTRLGPRPVTHRRGGIRREAGDASALTFVDRDACSRPPNDAPATPRISGLIPRPGE